MSDDELSYGVGIAFAGFGLAWMIWGSPDANPVTLCIIVGGFGLALVAKYVLFNFLFSSPPEKEIDVTDE